MEQQLLLQPSQGPQGPAAPTPFLSGTNVQYAWDSTSLGWLKTCPRLYQYFMVEGWSSKYESVHLRFGIEYHAALHDYELSRQAGIPHDDAVFDTINALLIRTGDFRPNEETHGKAGKYKSRENLIRTVIWYLDKFEHDKAETFILDNGKPAVELSFRFELDWGPITAETFKDTPDGGQFLTGNGQPYLLCGHLDRVVTFNDELFTMDRKTTTSTPSSWYFTQYEPDNQMTLYTLASQIVLGSPIKGVIIDAAQIALDFSRFGRGFTYRTKDQIEEWLHDLRYWLGKAEEYATANYWPMNDKACNNFRSEASGQVGCPFREVCSKSPQVRKEFLKSGFERNERWNPLKAR